MQPKHSTTEGRHDGIGIPSESGPFAVVNKNQQTKQASTMKPINKLTLAALAATVLLLTSITRADDHGVQRITFQKCFVPVPEEPFGGHFEGTVKGGCGNGTVSARYFAVAPGENIWHFSCEYTVVTSNCSFKTVCAGIVDVRSGRIVLNGVVTEGERIGALVLVRARANATLTCSEGPMTVLPSWPN
jgi:hypothetical protein